MAAPLQRTVATLLASLYLLIAAVGQGLHVHEHASATADCCCHHDCCENDSANRQPDGQGKEPSAPTLSRGGAYDQDAHECVACSLLAQMRLADGAQSPRLVSTTPLELGRTPETNFAGSAISRPIARGPPSDV